MGGILAFEVARRLEQAGATVDLLVLLDAPYAVSAVHKRDQDRAGDFVSDIARGAGWDTGNLPDPARTSADDQLAWLARHLSGQDGDSARAVAAQLELRYDIFKALAGMLTGYRPLPPPVHAPALIVSASRSRNAATWEQWPQVLAGPVSVLRPDAGHYDFLKPPIVADVAAAILAWQAGPAPPA